MLPRSRACAVLASVAAAAFTVAGCSNPATSPPPTPPKPAMTASAATSTEVSPPSTLASASLPPGAKAPAGPLVACTVPAPPMARAKEDAVAFGQALDVVARLDVLGVGGRVIFGRMGQATAASQGPGGGYLNRLYELEGGKIKPVKELQKGLWDDIYITSIEGVWPGAVTLRGINYGNTAWEEQIFVWDARANVWDTKQDGARAWPGGRIGVKQTSATPGAPERSNFPRRNPKPAG